MADLLLRTRDERDLSEGGRYLVRLKKGPDSQDFDLVGRLREGSLVYASSRRITVPSFELSWDEKAQEKALVFAQASGFDYALVESDEQVLADDRHQLFLAQFYVNTKR